MREEPKWLTPKIKKLFEDAGWKYEHEEVDGCTVTRITPKRQHVKRDDVK